MTFTISLTVGDDDQRLPVSRITHYKTNPDVPVHPGHRPSRWSTSTNTSDSSRRLGELVQHTDPDTVPQTAAI